MLKKLIEIISKFFKQGISTPAPPLKLARDLSVGQINHMLNSWYESQVGFKEVGSNKGPQVEFYQKTVDNKAVGEPWCMAYMQTGLQEVSRQLVEFVDLNHLTFREFFKEIPIYKSESCMSTWNNTPQKYIIDLKNPNSRFGSIGLCWFIQQQKVNPNLGHTGKCLVYKTDSIITNEGNTDGAGSREGDGVYNKLRSLQDSPLDSKRFRGFINVSQAIYDAVQKNSRVRLP